MKRWRLIALAAWIALGAPAFAQPADLTLFAEEIAAFEQEDATAPAEPGRTVFTGSSSVRFWNTLATDMAPLAVLNRGFGGSQIPHVNRHFERLVAIHRPAAIVFYCGDNDLTTDRPLAAIVADFETFLMLKQAVLGSVPVHFVAVKPSPARAALLERQEAFNAAIRALAGKRSDLHFIDVAAPMLDASGAPRAELFEADGLHLNAQGYALWTGIVRAALGLPPQREQHP